VERITLTRAGAELADALHQRDTWRLVARALASAISTDMDAEDLYQTALSA
jgi:DNA-directed RNA polymerase specialized sigma24 family protein